ncbi:MAG: acyl-CoA dehydrogenase family protein [Gemmatimonadota bacterium]
MALTQEQLELRALAREFAQSELRPHSARWDAERRLDADVHGKLAELGFFGMRVPEAYGGLGLDVPTYLTVLEQIAWGDASVALDLAIHNGPLVALLLGFADDAQKTRWLTPMASGDVLGAFALTEPQAGSDAAALSTRAERDGDGWRIRGRKRWVTNGARAGVVAVFARTGEGAHEVGLFLVEPGTDGYTVTGRETTLGLRATETVSVELDVRVDGSALVGQPGAAFGYAMQALGVGRLGIAAQAVGIAQAALEHAVAYALGREQFDRPLAAFGAIQEKLATMAIRVGAARSLLEQTAAALDLPAGPAALAPAAACAAAKVFASETAMYVADEAVQIFGGYGYMRDYPVEKLMRDAKGTEIYEGTNEVLRWIVARDLLGGDGASTGT